MKQAHDRNDFLQQNDYIKLEMLELQELLIKAGYLTPEERVINQDEQLGELGMEAASQVFFDLVLNSHPEAYSPQYDAFYEASIKGERKALSADNGDEYSQMRLHTLSSTLVGIQKQAMSFRRDAVDKDYPSEFYEKLLMPEEEYIDKHSGVMRRDLYNQAQKFFDPYVQMERTYLNGWRTFFDRTEDLPAKME